MDDDALITSGRIDSLTLVTLVMELESAARRRIPATRLDVGHFETIHTIARLLAGLAELSDERAQEISNIVQVDDRDKVCARYLATADSDRHTHPRIVEGQESVAWHRLAVRISSLQLLADERPSRGLVYSRSLCLDHPKGTLRTVVLALDVEGFSNAAPLDIRLAHSAQFTRYLTARDQARLPARPSAAVASADRRFDSISVQFKLGETEFWMLQGRWEAVNHWTDAGAADRTALHLFGGRPRLRRSLHDAHGGNPRGLTRPACITFTHSSTRA